MRIVVFACVIAVSVGTARADLAWHTSYQNPMSSWDAYMYDRVVKQKVLARTKAAQTKDTSDDASDAKRMPLSASDFKPAKPGHPYIDAFFAALPKEEAEQLRPLVDASVVEIEKNIRKNNVAAAMAVTIGMAVLHVNEYEMTENETDVLMANINDVVAGSAKFKKLKAADRQMMYDGLLLTTAMIMILHVNGMNDPKLRDAGTEIAKGALNMLTGSETASPG